MSAESPHPLAPVADRLVGTLAELVRAHEDLLALTGEHRAALSRADAGAVQECARRQAELARSIAALETQRRGLVAEIMPGQGATPFAVLANHLPEPLRGRIAAIARRLRELLVRIQEENRVIRTATQALIAHMDGLMQQVARTLSHAGLYGPRGRLDSAVPAPCGLDLTH